MSPAGASAASSDSTSFGRANEIPGTSGPKPSHFDGCPVAESAPSVRPWKPPSSATIRVRPVALRAILSAASLASAPELQKKARPPGKRSASSAGEPEHRLRPVEVRRVPEAVELLVGGRERRRRAMAETDNGDPGDEVEVLAARVVPDPAALAAHDRDVGAGVGRQHRVAEHATSSERAHATTSVAPIAARTPPRVGEDGRVELGDDAALEGAVAEHPVGVVDGDVLDHGALHQDAGDVADEHDPLGAEPDRERGRGLVGVDVERSDRARADRERRHDGDAAGRERLLDRRRRRRRRMPDEPERLHLGRLQADLVAEERERGRPDRGADVAVDLGERGAHDLQHLARRHPPPVDEGRVDAAALHLGRDLRPGAVDDDDVVALLPQGERLGRRGGGDAPAELDHDAAHVVYSALIRT